MVSKNKMGFKIDTNKKIENEKKKHERDVAWSLIHIYLIFY